MARLADHAWDVGVDLPGLASFAGVARTAVAGCAVLEGFSVDGLGDVRLLVDEVFTTLTARGVRRVALHVTAIGRSLRVDASGVRPMFPVGDLAVVEALAAVVATDVRNDLAADEPRFVAVVPVS
jgi:hypothetical protein